MPLKWEAREMHVSSTVASKDCESESIDSILSILKLELAVVDVS
jgi:hypothetical protein